MQKLYTSFGPERRTLCIAIASLTKNSFLYTMQSFSPRKAYSPSKGIICVAIAKYHLESMNYFSTFGRASPMSFKSERG